MYLSSIRIQNFKSFEDVTVHFHEKLNVLTGVNNSGKTTILEAIALWLECFGIMIREAGRGSTNRFNKGDYIFARDSKKEGKGNQYIGNFEIIKEFKSLNFVDHADIFFHREKAFKIILNATLSNENKDIQLLFEISNVGGERYQVTFNDHYNYDYRAFQDFFTRRYMPTPIGSTFATPLAFIPLKEPFNTNPQIKHALNQRESFKVLRNRIYQLHNNFKNTYGYHDFIDSLNFIIGNKGKNGIELELFLGSNVQNDVNVVYDFLEKNDAKNNTFRGELSLLGSGSIQIIEILLHLFGSEADKDLNLVLLDEPDSHIHRSIQQRLIETLGNFRATPTQVFLTTHNEALIESVNPDCLFHIEGKNRAEYSPIGTRLHKTGEPHFKGLFPTKTKNLISELRGNPNGLDMITVLEADRVILVEGEDDALAFDLLIKKYESTNYIRRMKIAFWVLGGVDEVFTRIEHYKTVLSAIKNDKTVWEKCVLVMDRDYLPDTYLSKVEQHLHKTSQVPIHIFNAYTFESTLLMDLSLLSDLLGTWIVSSFPSVSFEERDLLKYLQEAYPIVGNELTQNQETLISNEKVKTYLNKLINLGILKGLDPNKGVDFTKDYQKYIQDTLDAGNFYKLMNKTHVEQCINKALESYGLTFSIQDDFLNLIAGIKSNQIKAFSEWDFFLEKLN